jgi:hypothetical protein
MAFIITESLVGGGTWPIKGLRIRSIRDWNFFIGGWTISQAEQNRVACDQDSFLKLGHHMTGLMCKYR